MADGGEKMGLGILGGAIVGAVMAAALLRRKPVRKKHKHLRPSAKARRFARWFSGKKGAAKSWRFRLIRGQQPLRRSRKGKS